MECFGGITRERLNYIKAHVRFLQRRREINIHPFEGDIVWRMREDLDHIQNGELKILGTDLPEINMLMHDLDGLLSYNVPEKDC